MDGPASVLFPACHPTDTTTHSPCHDSFPPSACGDSPAPGGGVRLLQPSCAPVPPSPSAACSCGVNCEDEDREVAASIPLGVRADLVTTVERVAAELRRCRTMHLSKRVAVQRYLQALDVTSGELERYALFDEGKKYTRNLIATDGETFTVMLLCWNPGKESPIHDHPCDGCWMRVVQGSVLETRYSKDAASNTLKRTCEVLAAEGDVIYINDDIGLHKVGNPSPVQRACTLHVYSPPFQQCSIWLDDAAAADKPLRPIVTYFSEFGEVASYEQASSLCQ